MTIKQHILFRDLREANLKRIPLLKNAKGNPVHFKPDGSDWPPELWFKAFIGELGEYCSLSKKYSSGDFTATEFRALASAEIADMLTYLDIFFMHLNLNDHLEIDIDDYSFIISKGRSESDIILFILSNVVDVSEFLMGWRMNDEVFYFILKLVIALFDVNHIQRSPAIIHRFNHVSEQQGIEVYL